MALERGRAVILLAIIVRCAGVTVPHQSYRWLQRAHRIINIAVSVKKCGAIRTDDQIGQEDTVPDFVQALVTAFRAVHRVLRDDGLVFLNLGDSYSTGSGDGGNATAIQQSNVGSTKFRKKVAGFRSKNLMLVPHRVAIALQDDGWYLRSAIIWQKPNPMPESTRDRPTSSYEMIFMLAKSPKYFWDAYAIAERTTEQGVGSGSFKRIGKEKLIPGQTATQHRLDRIEYQHPAYRNIRNVWRINVKSFSGAHFATFPIEIPRRCIKVATSEGGVCNHCGAPLCRVVKKGKPLEEQRAASGADRYGTYSGQSTKGHKTAGVQDASEVKRRILAGMVEKKTIGWRPSCACKHIRPIPATVLDLFGGAGTTALAAMQLGRNTILCELKRTYAHLAKRRLRKAIPKTGLFTQATVKVVKF